MNTRAGIQKRESTTACCIVEEEVDLRQGRATSFCFNSSENEGVGDAFCDISGLVLLYTGLHRLAEPALGSSTKVTVDSVVEARAGASSTVGTRL